jgi:integrase
MSTTFLHPTRRVYYRRVSIPKRLRPWFQNRVEVWRSLKTADKDQASLRAAHFDAATQRLFVTLKRHGGRMTTEQIEALVRHWLELELDEAEDARTLGGPVTDDYREGVYHVLSDQFDEAHEALVTNNYRKVEHEADALLKAAGLPALDHAGADFGRLCRRLLLAKQEYLRIEADRWEGRYNHHRPQVSALSPASSATASTSPPSSPSKATGPLFSVVADKYMAENPRAARTAKPMKAELMKFVETIGGDKPLDTITKADARAYKEHLLTVRKLSALTLVKHLSALHTLYVWAGAQGFVEDSYNPIKGLSPNKKVARKQMNERRPFTDAELLQVFGSRDFLEQRDKNPSRYWLCLICLFTACRREEAGQLAVADIQEEDGITFFRINDDEKLGQTLKNAGSRRRVPVPSSLFTLGFKQYFEKIRAAGHVRLFPDFKKGGNGYSDATGKWFGRLVTKVGLHDPALVLHSLRGGGITKMHGAGVPHNVVEYIVGHSAGTVHDRVYTKRDLLPLSLLRDGLEKLRYDDVVKALLM